MHVEHELHRRRLGHLEAQIVADADLHGSTVSPGWLNVNRAASLPGLDDALERHRGTADRSTRLRGGRARDHAAAPLSGGRPRPGEDRVRWEQALRQAV